MKFILAKKVNMTQVFGEDGKVTPVTILDVPKMTVSQIKTKEKDGYSAIQVGSGLRKGKNISKAVKGHIKNLDGMVDGSKGFEVIKEFRMDEAFLSNFNKGAKISLDTFAVGDKVQVSSVSKSKGFQGVVKRHGFHGGPRSHGQKHSEREPGSIGGGGRQAGRVVKGMRMAGRTGGDRTTLKNLSIVGLDIEKGAMMVSGAVPGRRGTLVEVRSLKGAS